MTGVTWQSRADYLQQLRQNPEVPVLIVGAACQTAGLLRELALQGIPSLLISAQDFWMETAVSTSHLIHNDVSYRESGGFLAVKKAMMERHRLLQNAPHAVRPITTTIPIFRWVTGRFHVPIKLPQEADKTGRRGILFTRLGLMMQDTFTKAKGTLLRHEFALRDASLAQFPALNPDILGTATYHNAIVSFPEQLCQEMVADARQALPETMVLNYMSVRRMQGDTLTLRDEVSQELITIQPQLVFEQVQPKKQHRSIYLLIDHAELHDIVGGRAFFFEHENGRFVRIYPLNSQVMVNVTFPELDSLESLQVTKADLNSSINLIQQLFPHIMIQPTHICFQQAAATTNETPPYPAIKSGENTAVTFPIYQISLGNWHTYHSIADAAVEKVLHHFARSKSQQSKKLPIGGGKGFLTKKDERWRWFHKLSREHNLAFEHVKLLFARYGTQARTVAAFLDKSPDSSLKHHTDYTQRELLYLIHATQVVHLEDLILRRTQLAQQGRVTADLIAEIGQITCKALNWSQEQLQSELESTFTLLAKNHGVSLY